MSVGPSEPAADKDALRRELVARRRGLEPAWVAGASARIGSHVVALPEYGRARVVGTYLALPREVQTRALIEGAWAAGKAVLVPAFRRDLGVYGWAWLRPDARLAEGLLHVSEPAEPDWAGSARADLVLVPGVGFDAQGARMGRGRGWYDRLLVLPAARDARKVGLAFACQIVARVPMETRDIWMDLVVTEHGQVRRDGAGQGGH